MAPLSKDPSKDPSKGTSSLASLVLSSSFRRLPVGLAGLGLWDLDYTFDVLLDRVVSSSIIFWRRPCDSLAALKSVRLFPFPFHHFRSLVSSSSLNSLDLNSNSHPHPLLLLRQLPSPTSLSTSSFPISSPSFLHLFPFLPLQRSRDLHLDLLLPTKATSSPSILPQPDPASSHPNVSPPRVSQLPYLVALNSTTRLSQIHPFPILFTLVSPLSPSSHGPLYLDHSRTLYCGIFNVIAFGCA